MGWKMLYTLGKQELHITVSFGNIREGNQRGDRYRRDDNIKIDLKQWKRRREMDLNR
jgi:hypothetical protein